MAHSCRSSHSSSWSQSHHRCSNIGLGARTRSAHSKRVRSSRSSAIGSTTGRMLRTAEHACRAGCLYTSHTHSRGLGSLTRCHIYAGMRLAAATSALGLGSSLPHLQRDRARHSSQRRNAYCCNGDASGLKVASCGATLHHAVKRCIMPPAASPSQSRTSQTPEPSRRPYGRLPCNAPAPPNTELRLSAAAPASRRCLSRAPARGGRQR